MEQGKRHDNLWSVVLAGGDGVRTKEFIRRWLGHDKPKQYCTFLGNRSMFQHTLDRAVMLTPWERMVVIAARHHQNELWAQLDGRPAGMIVLQPSNADTAAGVFLPLSHILANDPDATDVVKRLLRGSPIGARMVRVRRSGVSVRPWTGLPARSRSRPSRGASCTAPSSPVFGESGAGGLRPLP